MCVFSAVQSSVAAEKQGCIHQDLKTKAVCIRLHLYIFWWSAQLQRIRLFPVVSILNIQIVGALWSVVAHSDQLLATWWSSLMVSERNHWALPPIRFPKQHGRIHFDGVLGTRRSIQVALTWLCSVHYAALPPGHTLTVARGKQVLLYGV